MFRTQLNDEDQTIPCGRWKRPANSEGERAAMHNRMVITTRRGDAVLFSCTLTRDQYVALP